MDYLDKLEKQANKMFARVDGWEINALKRVGRRVKDIRSLSYADLQTINNAAISNQDVNAVLEELAEITGQNVRDVKAAYDEMIAEQHEINRHLYDYRGKPFVPFKENKTLQAITRAFARTTAESFVNLSMTSAKRIGFVDAIGTFKPIDVAFTEVIDKAVMSVTTGTGDFNSEMLDVLRQLGGSGVRVDYGHGITRHLDSMVRQNMLWGAKQAYREYDRVIGEELGCDGVEIDWHSYPRPTHVFMQGKQYCLGKTRVINGTKFIGFEEKDPSSEEGKSASEALDDWGCLHFETSIICGISEPAYTPEELKTLNEKNNRPIEIDGVTKTGYEWKQSMRRLERGGKQAKMQRELFKAEGNLPEARKWDERLKMIEDKYQLVADKTGMKAQYEKMAVIKSKVLDNGGGSGIIKEKEVEYGIPYLDAAITADMKKIKSSEYISKFNITDNEKVNSQMAKCAQSAIEHRSGTKFEDMYIINANTGEIMGQQLEMTYESGISYNESILSALKKSKEEKTPIIAIHNHPEGLPPSVDDFNKALDNNYYFGLACGHNGQVYMYNAPGERISNTDAIHEEITTRYRSGIDVDRAYREAYELIGVKYKIMRGEVANEK